MTIRKNGFSLIEILAVIVITGLVAAIAGNLLITSFNNYYNARDLNDLTTQANVALLKITGELRRALTFTTISSSQLSFTTASNTTVTYNLTGNLLTRQQNSGSSYTLVNQVSALTFSYFDQNGATTNAVGAVSFITISITLSNSTHSYSLVTTVHPRMLS